MGYGFWAETVWDRLDGEMIGRGLEYNRDVVYSLSFWIFLKRRLQFVTFGDILKYYYDDFVWIASKRILDIRNCVEYQDRNWQCIESKVINWELFSRNFYLENFPIFNGNKLKKKKKKRDGRVPLYGWKLKRARWIFRSTNLKNKRGKFLAIKVDRAWRFNDRWSQSNSRITKAQVRTIKVKMPVGFQFSILFQAWQKSGACGGYLINVPFLRAAISSRSKKVGR